MRTGPKYGKGLFALFIGVQWFFAPLNNCFCSPFFLRWLFLRQDAQCHAIGIGEGNTKWIVCWVFSLISFNMPFKAFSLRFLMLLRKYFWIFAGVWTGVADCYLVEHYFSLICWSECFKNLFFRVFIFQHMTHYWAGKLFQTVLFQFSAITIHFSVS